MGAGHYDIPKMKLTGVEFNKRCHEVFESQSKRDVYYFIEIVNGEVIIPMTEYKDFIQFDYKPDMSERPQALDYLLGNRDDFND